MKKVFRLEDFKGEEYAMHCKTSDNLMWLDRGGSIDIYKLIGKVYRRPPERQGSDADHARAYFEPQRGTVELEKVRAELDCVTAEKDAAIKRYEAEKEDFLDYVLSGTRNAAPFCTNRHPDCVDKRDWCIPVKCHGFSRDKED